MGDKRWKGFERDVAKILGWKRRGADYVNELGGGTNDFVGSEPFSAEAKHYKSPRWGVITAAVKQAEDAAKKGEWGIAIVHQKGSRVLNSMVCMRLETFADIKAYIDELEARLGE